MYPWSEPGVIQSFTFASRSQGGVGGTPSDVCPAGCYSCSGSICIPEWSAMSAPPVELVARAQAAYAAGNGKLLIWGGVGADGVDLNSGALYDPALDAWQVMTVSADTLGPRVLANAAWTGSKFLIWGGRASSWATEYTDGALYDPATQTWASIAHASNARAAALTFGHSGQVLSAAGWNKEDSVLEQGERGRDDEGAIGKGLSLEGTDWVEAATQAEPSARWAPQRQSGWSCRLDEEHVAIVGGHDANGNPLLDGGIYDRTLNAWASIPAASGAHDWGVGACVNGEILLWGGSTDGEVTAAGERWALLE